MGLSAKLRTSISIVVLGISILAWVILLVNPGHIMGVEHCHVSASGPSAASLDMLLKMNPFSSLLLGWGLMVVAMMMPKLVMPIRHIYSRSFKSRRFSSASLFVLGYIAVWMVVGVVMTAIIIAVNLLMPNSYVPAIILGVIVLIWEFSPVKQVSLNNGHEHPTLSAFGWEASRDALVFGVKHGVWCVASGWALMLLPMLLPQGHNLAMFIVTIIMVSEHLEHPQPPRWRLIFRRKLMLIAYAQTRIRLKQALNPA